MEREVFCRKHDTEWEIEPPIEYQIDELVQHLSGRHESFCAYCAEAFEVRQRGEEDIAIEEHVMGYDGSRGCLACEHKREQDYDEAEYMRLVGRAL